MLDVGYLNWFVTSCDKIRVLGIVRWVKYLDVGWESRTEVEIRRVDQSVISEFLRWESPAHFSWLNQVCHGALGGQGHTSHLVGGLAPVAVRVVKIQALTEGGWMVIISKRACVSQP